METEPPQILTRSHCDKAKCPRRRQQVPAVTIAISGDGVEAAQRPGFLSLPREIQLIILAYLGSRDLHTVRQVSVYFKELARDPMLWKDYEVLGSTIDTKNVINDLKRMPFLKKICINNRMDCDDILRQISLSNKNLEQLSVINCTGSTAGLQLRAGYLTRLVKRCRRLHTFRILGTRFRGLKIFRMMGEAGPRLRVLSATTTRAQFQTFARNAKNIAEKDRKLLSSLCQKPLSILTYRMITESNGQSKIFIMYRDNLLGLTCLEFKGADETDVTVASSLSPSMK